MADDELDLNEPLPDRAHEAIRRSVLKAIEDGEWNTADVDLSLDMSDTLFQLLTTVQADIAALQGWRELLAAASGDALDVIETDGGWTWTRTASNGEEISRGEDYTREADAWRGGHRANPDL